MILLSELAGATVVDERGRAIGHFVDLRACDRRRGGTAPVSGLVCGAIGLLERFGLRAPGGTHVAWRRVLRVEGARIVVQLPPRARGKRRD